MSDEPAVKEIVFALQVSAKVVEGTPAFWLPNDKLVDRLSRQATIGIYEELGPDSADVVRLDLVNPTLVWREP
jgi:hypothetical protein